MNKSSNNLTTTCDGLDMLHSTSSWSLVIFKDKYKDILTKASCLSGKIGHPKAKTRIGK